MSRQVCGIPDNSLTRFCAYLELQSSPQKFSVTVQLAGRGFAGRFSPWVSVYAALSSHLSARSVNPTHQKDFPVSQSIVWNQWRHKKMDDDECYRDLVRCRDPRAPQALAAFEDLRKKETMQNLQDEIERVQEQLRSLQRPFKRHPRVTKWHEQFLHVHYGKVPRKLSLGFVGGSMQGKSSMGMSIFGISHTLKVSCAGCPKGVLPGLTNFVRGKHFAILFDEVRVDQILDNREFFQSSAYPQQLSQSLCNQYAYQVWVYHVGMILCANHLPMTEEEGLTSSDADWMQANVVLVTLPEGQTWYLQAGETEPPPSMS